MDRQEKHRQQKEKDRDLKNKEEQAYEDEQQKHRLVMNPAWLVIGVALILFVIYTWTVALW